MENINHVNKYFFWRILHFPLVFLYFLYKLIKVFRGAKRYVIRRRDISVFIRYDDLFRLFRVLYFMKSIYFHYIAESRVPKVPVIFVINEKFSWNYLSLVRQLVKDNNLPLTTFYLRHEVLKNPLSWVLDLIDVIYDTKSAERILKLKRSLIFDHESFLDQKNLELVHNNTFSIVPIYVEKTRKLFFFHLFFIFGYPIKAHEFIHLERKVLVNKLDSAFKKLRDEMGKYKKVGTKFSINYFFSLKD